MPTNLYGPNDNFDLLSSHVLAALLRKFHEAQESDQSTVTLWGTGAATREFLHVDDLARAILYCLKNYNDDLPLNVGTGVETSVKDLAMQIAKIVGYSGQIEWDRSKPDGTPRKVLDVKRINNLGWRHEIDLLPGIEQTYKWFKESQRESSS
jgi:GDP-L-fucose synthase